MSRASYGFSHRGCFDDVMSGRKLGEKERAIRNGLEKFFALIVFDLNLGAAEIMSIFQRKAEPLVVISGQ